MAEKAPLNAVKMVTDETGRVTGVEDIENGQSIPTENVSDISEFVCKEAEFAPYGTNAGGSRWGSVGDAIGRLANGIKDVVEPAIDGAIGILEGAKELCATLIQKAKEEAAAQNMKKGAEDCAIKDERPSSKGTSAKNDTVSKEGDACPVLSGGNGLQQAVMKDNGEEFRGEANEEGKAGRGVVHAEAFWDAGGMDAAGRGPWAETKKEDAPDGTAVILPGHKAHKDGTAAEAGDRRAEQAIKDKAEQAKELEITLKMADAAPLHEGAGKDKGGVKEGRSSGHSRDHEDSDPPSDVTEAFTRAFGAPDVGSAEVEGERWVSLAPSPFASNENAPLTRVPYLSQPVTAGAEEPFPAIVQNFIGFFTYMRSQRNANEHGAGAPGRMQVVNTERGEAVWPAGKKEGGENRSDHGGSSGEGQKRGDEEDEIIFYKTA